MPIVRSRTGGGQVLGALRPQLQRSYFAIQILRRSEQRAQERRTRQQETSRELRWPHHQLAALAVERAARPPEFRQSRFETRGAEPAPRFAGLCRASAES